MKFQVELFSIIFNGFNGSFTDISSTKLVGKKLEFDRICVALLKNLNTDIIGQAALISENSLVTAAQNIRNYEKNNYYSGINVFLRDYSLIENKLINALITREIKYLYTLKPTSGETPHGTDFGLITVRLWKMYTGCLKKICVRK